MNNKILDESTDRSEKLVYTAAEVKGILGVSGVTLWRLEKRGLLRAVTGIRHKLYSKNALLAFLEGDEGATV